MHTEGEKERVCKFKRININLKGFSTNENPNHHMFLAP